MKVLLTFDNNNYKLEKLSNYLQQRHISYCSLALFKCQSLPIDNSLISIVKKADIIIFSSANAVNYSQKLHKLLDDKLLLSIGKNTTRTMQKYALIANITAQKPFGSESLLRSIALQKIANKHIVLLTADPNRGYLQQILENRKAKITTISVYSIMPTKIQLPKDFFTESYLIIISNALSLKNLIQNLDNQHKKQFLIQQTVLVISERLKSVAKNLGLTKIIVSENASLTAICKKIMQYY
mgnify:CR=1 FL=1